MAARRKDPKRVRAGRKAARTRAANERARERARREAAAARKRKRDEKVRAAKLGAARRRKEAPTPRELPREFRVTYRDKLGRITSHPVRGGSIWVRHRTEREATRYPNMIAASKAILPAYPFDDRSSRMSRDILESVRGRTIWRFRKRNATFDDLQSSVGLMGGLLPGRYQHSPTVELTAVVTFRGVTTVVRGVLAGADLRDRIVASLGRLSDAEKARMWGGASKRYRAASALGVPERTLVGLDDGAIDRKLDAAGVSDMPLEVRIIAPD